MVWETLALGAAKIVADLVSPSKPQETPNYRIRGHVQGMPVDCEIQKCSSGSSSSFVPHPPQNPITTSATSQQFQPTQKPITTLKSKKFQQPQKPTTTSTSSIFRQNRNKEETCKKCSNNCNNMEPKKAKDNNQAFCMVKLPPGDGNFEVTIKKTSENVKKMSINNKQKNKPEMNNQRAEKGEKPKYTDNNNPQRKINIPKTPSWTWMYVGRVKNGTKEFDLKNFLEQKFPLYKFTVEMLPLYKDAKLPSFKIKVDNKILNEFQNLNNWPQGVKITRYNANFKY